MFEYIKGVIKNINANYLVIENNDIGYVVLVANPYRFAINENVIIYLYNHIRENCYDLYGFKTLKERELFLKLLSVNGVGPKLAQVIIATDDIISLEDAIANGDSKYLRRIPGIGTKVSETIIFALRGKLNPTISSNPKLDKVKEALKVLGYKNTEVEKLDKFLLANQELSVEDLIKQSLKQFLK